MEVRGPAAGSGGNPAWTFSGFPGWREGVFLVGEMAPGSLEWNLPGNLRVPEIGSMGGGRRIEDVCLRGKSSQIEVG